MKTFKVVVRYISLEADLLQGKVPQEMFVEADKMTVEGDNLVFYAFRSRGNEAVAIFSYWEYAMEVEQR